MCDEEWDFEDEFHIGSSYIHISAVQEFKDTLTNKIERATNPKMNNFHKGFIAGLKVIEGDLERFIKEME